jgi:transposase
MSAVLGIDVSKNQLDVVLVREDGRTERAQFVNGRKGFHSLHHFLKKRVQTALHACLEATGSYGDEIALFLFEAGYKVSVINPAQIKSYGDSRLSRTKTDASDAALIADFCRTQQPPAWMPPPPELRELQALLRHLEALTQMRQQEVNRRDAGILSAIVLDALNRHIAFLDQEIADLQKRIRNHVDRYPDLRQQRDLLTTIPGIGDLTAARLLAELPIWREFTSPKQVAAFAGLSPRQHQSGSSVRGRTRLSKRGSSRLRTMLYFPAIVAQRHNPALARFAQRLRDAGKPKMAVLAAVMRKLLLLAYAILKSGHPFDLQFTSRASLSA